jgi:hypothetical protein
MAVAYKVAGNSPRLRGRNYTGVIIDELPQTNPWQPYKLKLLPRTINERRYWPGDTVYRRWRLSPGGGYWQYGDEFDYLKWQP